MHYIKIENRDGDITEIEMDSDGVVEMVIIVTSR